jgi:hypothetical protein
MPEIEAEAPPQTTAAATQAGAALSPGARVRAFWQEIHNNCLSRSSDAELRKLDMQPLVVLVVCAVALLVIRFVGKDSLFSLLVPPPSWTEQRNSYWELWSMAWWSGWSLIGYVLLPVLAVRALPGERLRDYGFSWSGFSAHWRLYLLLYLLVLPLAVLMSHTESFQRIYPFYKQANRSLFDFMVWEALYAAQFVGLEFFFRGFMLHGVKRSLGLHAVWVMVIPYCMIHFGKTAAESAGAIVAGVVLGTISLRTNSIWGGVAIHVAVAATMDLLTLRYL